jgi:hypothetical protein
MPVVDVCGKRYAVTATIGKMRRCRDQLGIDLLKAESGGVASVLTDYDSLIDVLCIFTTRVGSEGPLNDDQLQILMDDCGGKDVNNLTAALGQALENFFREDERPDAAEQVATVFHTMLQARKKLAQKIKESDILTESMAALDRMDLNEELKETLTDGPT